MKQKLTFKKFYDEYGVLLILLVMVAIFSFATPTFLTGANIINISKQVAIMAILSVGMTLVLVSGGGSTAYYDTWNADIPLWIYIFYL